MGDRAANTPTSCISARMFEGTPSTLPTTIAMDVLVAAFPPPATLSVRCPKVRAMEIIDESSIPSGANLLAG